MTEITDLEVLLADTELMDLWRDYRYVTAKGANPFAMTFVQYIAARAMPPPIRSAATTSQPTITDARAASTRTHGL